MLFISPSHVFGVLHKDLQLQISTSLCWVLYIHLFRTMVSFHFERRAGVICVPNWKISEGKGKHPPNERKGSSWKGKREKRMRKGRKKERKEKKTRTRREERKKIGEHPNQWKNHKKILLLITQKILVKQKYVCTHDILRLWRPQRCGKNWKNVEKLSKIQPANTH